MSMLQYISIRESNTKSNCLASIKQEEGEIIPLSEGSQSVKFKFIPRYQKVPKLVKIYDDPKVSDNLRVIKTLFDEGVRGFRYSPIAYALPIGYNSFLPQELKALGYTTANTLKPYLVFVFKENCVDLQSILKNDDYHAIIEGSVSFDYLRRFQLAGQLFELYSCLENINRIYPSCKQLQILHYDIKPENYIVDITNNSTDISIVDLDQGGVFDILENDYLLVNEKENFRFKPTADLKEYDHLFLPYEVVMEKGSSLVKSDDPLYWNQKERFTEIWMSWLLIFRVLTGLENPFLFSLSQDHFKVNGILKAKGITDLFSRHAFISGDLFDSITDVEAKNQYIDNILSHYDKTLPKFLTKMMNEVFIKGFFVFNLRPSSYNLSREAKFP